MAASNPDRSKLLSGITVLDFTHALAGPTCTRILSDLGAEVIKLEPAPNGEFGRSLFPVQGGLGSMFLYTCAGKKSLCVDLKKPDGMKIATGLIAKVDVMVENFAPGAMARLGLDYESVARINPKIIMASCSGFGQTGPLSKNTSYDIIGQAMSSVMQYDRRPGRPAPVCRQLYWRHQHRRARGPLAVCAALFYRDRSGKGQLIDIAQVDSLFFMDMINVPLHALTNVVSRTRSALARTTLGSLPWASSKAKRAMSCSRRLSINSPNWQKPWVAKTW